MCPGSGPSEDQGEASQEKSHEDQGQEQQPSPLPVDGDSAAPSSSNNTSLSPSDSSSSLHSILKKPSISTSEDTGSEAADQHDQRKHQEKKSPRLKGKKSVSFAEDTSVPTAKPPGAPRSCPSTTAAEEGAAIARKLAERKSKWQGGGKASRDLGGGDGGANPRRSSHSSRHGQGPMSSTSGMKKILKQTTAPSGVAETSGGECGGKNGTGGQVAGGGPSARKLFSDENDESCIDDEISRAWQ